MNKKASNTELQSAIELSGEAIDSFIAQMSKISPLIDIVPNPITPEKKEDTAMEKKYNQVKK